MTVLLAMAGLLLLGLGWLNWRDAMARQARRRARLALLAPVGKAGPARPGPLRRLGDWLADTPLVGNREVGLLRQNLYAAGFTRPDAVDWHIGFKMVLAGLLIGVAVLWVQIGQPSATSALLVLLGSALVGLKGPDAVLHQRASARRAAIDRGLPDALDLLVVCAEAGISLELALERVATELKGVHPELATELAVTVSEMRLQADRLQALANMGERVRLDSVRIMASTLSQTMRYGTPLGRALRTMTADFRFARQMKMEATAARLPVIITLPMIMFILPSTALVVAGPAFLQLIDALRRLA